MYILGTLNQISACVILIQSFFYAGFYCISNKFSWVIEHLSSAGDLDAGDVDVDNHNPSSSSLDVQGSDKYYDDMISRINQQLAQAVEKGQSPYSIYGIEDDDEEDWC